MLCVYLNLRIDVTLETNVWDITSNSVESILCNDNSKLNFKKLNKEFFYLKLQGKFVTCRFARRLWKKSLQARQIEDRTISTRTKLVLHNSVWSHQCCARLGNQHMANRRRLTHDKRCDKIVPDARTSNLCCKAAIRLILPGHQYWDMSNNEHGE